MSKKVGKASIINFPDENPNPICRIMGGKIIYINRPARKILKIKKGEKVPGFLGTAVLKAFKEKKSIKIEFKIRKNSYLFLIAQGKNADYVNLYGVDISDIKKAELKLDAANQQLNASNQQLKASNMEIKNLSKFPEENTSPVMRVLNNKTIYVNKAAKKFLGISEDKPLTGLIKKTVIDTIKSGKSQSVVISVGAKSYQVTCIPVKGEKYINLYGVDISDIKKAELKLDAANQQLNAFNQQLNAANQQLNASNQQLNASNQQLKTSENKLFATNNVLIERIKELNCLYSLSELVQRKGVTTKNILGGLVKIIPSSWQYPEITCARITFSGKKYETKNFKKTKYIQSADIKVGKKKEGKIEVAYLRKKPELDEGPFTKEERLLINSLAERLGSSIEHNIAEKKLCDAEYHLKRIIDLSPGIIATADANTGCFLTINRAISNILGFSRQYFLSKPFMEFIHPDDCQRTIDKVTKQLKGSAVASFENRYICKNGSYKWLSWQATSADENGIVYATAIDITERKTVEDNLKDISKKLLKVRDEEKKGLAIDLHDELSAMTIKLSSKISIIKEDIIEDKKKNALENINKVSDILKYEIRKLKKIAFNLSPADVKYLGLSHVINRYIDNIKDKLHFKIKYQSVMEKKNIPNGKAIVIYRIMQEAINNIIKHAAAKNVKVKLSSLKNGDLYLNIRDDGKGFDMESLKKKKKVVMGIWGMKERAESQGGEFVIKPARGKGVEIKIFIPEVKHGNKNNTG